MRVFTSNSHFSAYDILKNRERRNKDNLHKLRVGIGVSEHELNVLLSQPLHLLPFYKSFFFSSFGKYEKEIVTSCLKQKAASPVLTFLYTQKSEHTRNIIEGNFFLLAENWSSSMASSLVSKSSDESDATWEALLPPDYEDVLKAVPWTELFRSKKELYDRLCNYLPIGTGNLFLFKLEKSTGKKCLMLSTGYPNIAMEGVESYWTRTSMPESRFSEVVKLKRVRWLEIGATINSVFFSPKTLYGAYLILKFEKQASGLDAAPSEITVEIGSRVSTRRAYLPNSVDNSSNKDEDEDGGVNPNHEYNNNNEDDDKSGDVDGDLNSDDNDEDDEFDSVLYPEENGNKDETEKERERLPYVTPRRRDDGWMEIELGYFFFDGTQIEVTMKLKENSNHWKRGIIIQGIEVRPRA
ncbi:PREDICTED: putative F-box protein PP2-B12 [Nelumbo nucifera]|uniref:F-box protein PP2-B12 n=2 Tax=Nelumbo nucifera TaxID=4432 RepID=A0A1U7Z3D5_NELNU|nr:PREDICTED: putative F-box protein PP2-B12 [Nelumbo nucifera]DAD18204.1 TPA_asm: hypothetical protein HUJ06_019667 [Nelumbo nucifera]